MNIFEWSLEYHLSLNSFKISYKSSDFSVKILNFLWRSGGLAPRTHLSGKYWIIIFCLGGRPSNFRKKLQLQEENLGKIHKNSLASGGSAPEPLGRIKVSIILIFLSNSVQKFIQSLESY